MPQQLRDNQLNLCCMVSALTALILIAATVYMQMQQKHHFGRMYYDYHHHYQHPKVASDSRQDKDPTCFPITANKATTTNSGIGIKPTVIGIPDDVPGNTAGPTPATITTLPPNPIEGKYFLYGI